MFVCFEWKQKLGKNSVRIERRYGKTHSSHVHNSESRTKFDMVAKKKLGKNSVKAGTTRSNSVKPRKSQ